MSPMAHSPSPALIRSSTSTERADGSSPTVSSPTSSRLGVAPGRDEQLLGGRAPGRRPTTVNCPSAYETDGDLDVGQHLDALTPEDVARAGRRPRAPPGRGCAAPTSSTVTRTPNRASACASSAPIGPPPITRERAGSGLDAEDLAVGPERRVGEAVDRRRRRAGAGVEHDAPATPRTSRRRPRRCGGRPAGRGRARSGRRRPRAASPRRRRPSRRWPRRGSGRATGAQSGRTSADPARPSIRRPSASSVGGADDHLAGDAAVVGALATHQPLVDPDHVEPGLRQLGRRRLATRAEPDHHHVARFAMTASQAPAVELSDSTVVTIG